MDLLKENPEARANTLTGPQTLTNFDSSEATPNPAAAQEENRHSPAVVTCLARHREHLFQLKRASIASLANMAGASLDGTIEALENVDDDVMIERGARFIENARGFAKLLADFRDTREASR